MSFEIKQRTDQKLIITVKDNDGTVIDLSGASVSFIVSRAVTSDVIFEKTLADGVAIPQPATGKIEIDLTDDDTDIFGEYYCECLVIDVSANRSIVFTDTVTFVRTNPNH